jgi:hypothetical protein
MAGKRFIGPLAQLVEQLTLNQRVGGSTPPRPTILQSDLVVSLFPSVDVVPRHPSQIVFKYGTANVAELVDALDLGSSGVTRESSSLSIRTSLRS